MIKGLPLNAEFFWGPYDGKRIQVESPPPEVLNIPDAPGINPQLNRIPVVGHPMAKYKRKPGHIKDSHLRYEYQGSYMP